MTNLSRCLICFIFVYMTVACSSDKAGTPAKQQNGATAPLSAPSDLATDFAPARPIFTGAIGYGTFSFINAAFSVTITEATKEGSNGKFLFVKFSSKTYYTAKEYESLTFECQGGVCDFANQLTITWINKDRFDLKLSKHEMQKPNHLNAGEYYREGTGPVATTYGFVKPPMKVADARFIMVPKGTYSAHAGTHETVEIERDFEIQSTVVTQGQYFASAPTKEEAGRFHAIGDADKICPGDVLKITSPLAIFTCAYFPIINISWNEVHDLIGRLNSSQGLDCGDTSTDEGFAKASQTPGCFRLPTRNEWFAVTELSSKPTVSPSGDLFSATEFVWGSENTPTRLVGASLFALQPVASKRPNAMGIYDLYGNVKQWLQDRGDYPLEYNRFYCGMGSRNPIESILNDSCAYALGRTNSDDDDLSVRLVRTK